VYKPIYYPVGYWGYQNPLFAYQGTIQHIPMPPKVETEKPEAKTEEKAEEKAEVKEAPAASEMEKEDEPAKAEETPKAEEASEVEKEDKPAEPAKAKRDAASIAKRFGSRTRKNKKSQ